MFKLVGVGGRIRGKEFELREGENFFGRSGEIENQVDFDGISKKHFVLRNDSSTLQLEDLKSSNGTFINNELVSVRNLNTGDIIAIPNAIFKVVKINKKILKLYDKNTVSSPREENRVVVPKDLVGKIKYYFGQKLMAPIYSLNKSYEWSSLVFMVFFIFIITNILLIMDSTLRDSNKAILSESLLRGEQYVDEVIRRNAVFMGRKEYQQMDVSFLERVMGIDDYFVFDSKGRILRPIESLNIGINDSFSVQAKEWLDSKGGREDKAFMKRIGESKIGIAKVIKAYNLERQREDIVGYVTLIYQPSSLMQMASTNRVAYLEALIISSILGIFFCSIILYLTKNYLEELTRQIEDAQANKIKEVHLEFMMQESKPLRSIVNDMIFKIRELGDDQMSDFDEVEDDRHYLEILKEVLKGFSGAGVVLNVEKSIISLNQAGEDLLGIRESMTEGVAIEEILRDQGLAATIISLCDQSASDQGKHCSEVYEVGGTEYAVSSMTILGKDSFAKGYLVSFRKE